MLKKILVVVRGRDVSQPAIQRAALCAGTGTRLVLFDLVHEPALDGYMGNKEIYAPLRARVVAERAEYMRDLVETLRARGLDAAGEAAWDHPLDEAVARRVREHGADLVVTTPSGAGEGGLSASEWRLVTTCPAPVLVVRGPAPAAYKHIVAAVDPYHAHGKPADLDAEILAMARALQTDGSSVAAVHCFVPVEYFGADLSAPAGEIDGRRERVEVLLRDAGLPAAAARVERGAPAEVIQRLAETGEADVIVIGAIARGRLKDWIIGSTAERVLHDARVDVLAVKPAAR